VTKSERNYFLKRKTNFGCNFFNRRRLCKTNLPDVTSHSCREQVGI
jgi:hypothetical protein